MSLGSEVSHQLARVLRASPGDRITVLDDSGWEYLVTLRRVSPRHASGEVTERVLSTGEPKVRITLYQAVLKAGSFELVLQKGTELGISVFVPVTSARSVPKVGESGLTTRRYERWNKIVREAAEQSHRGRLPTLAAPLKLSEACEAVEGPAVIPWEEERSTGLAAAMKGWREAGRQSAAFSVFVGPEGGFTAEEVALARAKGIVPVSLGSRTLRAETAAVAAVSAILYELGELGG